MALQASNELGEENLTESVTISVVEDPNDEKETFSALKTQQITNDETNASGSVDLEEVLNTESIQLTAEYMGSACEVIEEDENDEKETTTTELLNGVIKNETDEIIDDKEEENDAKNPSDADVDKEIELVINVITNELIDKTFDVIQSSLNSDIIDNGTNNADKDAKVFDTVHRDNEDDTLTANITSVTDTNISYHSSQRAISPDEGIVASDEDENDSTSSDIQKPIITSIGEKFEELDSPEALG